MRWRVFKYTDSRYWGAAEVIWSPDGWPMYVSQRSFVTWRDAYDYADWASRHP